MTFDVYYSFRNKEGKVCPGIKPNPMEWAEIKEKVLNAPHVKVNVDKYRNTGDTEAKMWLPAINFVGTSKSTRMNSAMVPTQLVMIDIDHCENPREAWQSIIDRMTWEWIEENVDCAHISPSGKGLHIFFVTQGYATLKENMDWLNEQCDFQQYGDYDSVVHDFARISFAFPLEDLLYESPRLLSNELPTPIILLQNPAYNPNGGKQENEGNAEKATASTSNNSTVPQYTDEEKEEMKAAEWRGIPLQKIIDAWVAYRGVPGPQEVHNYYNEMIKYFRNIMGNNKKLVFLLLPKFGHSDEECWSQVQSICRSNTLSKLDRPFYFFLKDKGFFVSTNKSSIDNYLLADEDTYNFGEMPTPPPVFREFLKTAPKDFRIPLVNALLPILGTLSSYVQAEYPYDNQMHTTSFFSIIYAPPGTGKGFISRLMFLFDDLNLRDMVQQAREDIYLRVIRKKGANDKAPEQPLTSLRIIPPKNSEAEFLQKQKDNHGYHMFTYAAEMDSWAKGEKAAGGNKSDMIRIAWDNGEYGQQFKSAQTFKGKVRLYWNVLITGTQNQVENYFKNVENGLVTRCSFTSIENQEFQLASLWKPLNKKALALIRRYMKRCDDNTYEEPCNIVPDDLLSVSDDDFDNEIDWKFKFKERQSVDISWIMPVIEEFHERQCKQALRDIDKARDVFRRRVGVRGFRLALLCYTLYPQVTNRAVETIKNFVRWWMDVDMDCILKLWGAKYNEQAEIEPQLYNRTAFKSLADSFSKNDLFVVLKQQNIKTPVRQIIYQWKKAGYIEKTDNDTYTKKK